MKIDFNQVITNALSALVTLVLISAFGMMWRGYSTIDTSISLATDEIKKAVEELTSNTTYTVEAVELIEEELANLHNRIDNIPTEISEAEAESEVFFEESFQERPKEYIQRQLPNLKKK
jgi:hypothetical protein